MKRLHNSKGAVVALGLSVATLGFAAIAPGSPLIQPASAKPPAPMAFCHAYPGSLAQRQELGRPPSLPSTWSLI